MSETTCRTVIYYKNVRADGSVQSVAIHGCGHDKSSHYHETRDEQRVATACLVHSCECKGYS